MRTDRNIQQQTLEKKRRRRTIILVIIVLLMMSGIYAEVMMLKNMTSVDRRFTRSAGRGLMDGWSLQNNELDLRKFGRLKDAAFIETEWDAVSEFRNKPYKDKDLEKLAKKYILALRDCRKAIRKADPEEDFDSFWELFSEPYGKRIVALYEFLNSENRPEIRDQDYSSEIDNIMLQGWLIKKSGSIRFRNAGTSDTSTEYEAEFVNDSGFDLEYLDLEIELYNSNGTRVDTVSSYQKNIMNDETVVIRFYHSGKTFVDYKIVSVAADGSRPPEPEETEEVEKSTEESAEDGSGDMTDETAEETTEDSNEESTEDTTEV